MYSALYQRDVKRMFREMSSTLKLVLPRYWARNLLDSVPLSS